MRRAVALGLWLFCLLGCGWAEQRGMEVTAYCKCGKCNSYTRGSWKFLKLDRWNRYVSAGPDKGQRYTGLTANGSRLRQPHPGLFSLDSLKHPWMIPLRTLAFPWVGVSQKGAIAADTNYYPFGTLMYVPGYGWGEVVDRGGDIKGPERIDIYFRSHRRTLEWGRQRVTVDIERS